MKTYINSHLIYKIHFIFAKNISKYTFAITKYIYKYFILVYYKKLRNIPSVCILKITYRKLPAVVLNKAYFVINNLKSNLI